ncbi:general secretion pathway protein D [Pararobbsia alpina]|uniref:cohesin domain-containing protein n=1 Tax=Pararobbsia alpina TaxID=621374 RepID=UPI0039A482B5
MRTPFTTNRIPRRISRRILRYVSTLAAPALLVGVLASCAQPNAYRDGQQAVANGKVDEGLAKLQEASRQDPKDAIYRSTFIAEREKALVTFDEQGDRLAATGSRDAARKMYERALAIEPNNERAIAGIASLENAARLDALMSRAEAFAAHQQPDEARRVLNTVLTEAPANRRALALKRRLDMDSGPARVDAALAAAYRKPIRIDFRDAPLKQIFEVISHSSGLNFLFDKDVKTDTRTSIYLKNSTIDATVRYVLATNQLAQQVLDENTVLIYPATPAKQKDYQELAVRTFFLSYTDAKTIANTLKTIVKSHDVVADEKLNVVIVRDTPDAIKMAEKLVALEDVPEPEVMLEVEVLEVSRTKLQNLGIAWPGSISVTPLPVGTSITSLASGATSGGTTGSTTLGTTSTGSGTSPALTLSDLAHQTSRTLGLSQLQATANANLQDSDAKLLTNPRIRVHNHEKAKILIGERVPNITSTATSTGFVSQSVNYLDIGLTLQVEPTIFLDDTVGIKVSLEVSSLLNTVAGTSGTTAYEIGTRTASTVLQLKNGETDVLAGLIDSEERTSGNKLPGLGNLPVLGRLFGATTDDDKDTEIVLSITPHLVRNIQRPDANLAYFTSGTESNMHSMVQSNGLPAGSTPGVAPAAAPSSNSAHPGSNGAQNGLNNGFGSNGGLSNNGLNSAFGDNSSYGSNGSNGSNSSYGGGTGTSYAGDSAPYVGAAAGDPGTAQMTIEGPPSAKIGDTVSVAMTMQADQPVSSVSSTVTYDSTKLQFIGATEGDFLRQGGAPTSFSNRVAQGGHLILSDTAQGGSGAASQGTFAVLNFKAVAAASQTSIQVQPGSVIGVTGAPITMTPPSAYTFGVAGSP